MNRYTRSEMLIGKENIEKLNSKKILVFGLGGVGGSLCEAILRSGVRQLTIVDCDIVDITNLNRQLIATNKTIGRKKVDAMEERLMEIDPQARIEKVFKRLSPDRLSDFSIDDYDFIADAIDDVKAKLALAEFCFKNDYRLISAMGAGNRMDPTKLRIGDIYDTSMDPLARVIRRELKKRGVKNLTVVYSLEEPIKLKFRANKESTPGSMAFVPPVSGMIMASYIVKELIKQEKNEL
ncbi:tRNA threonylcarbamoyladenosine dehydratase [Peptoniphilus catoniae]|uniref:tRNA threonylcarbamoyladenosine dehydratase n=1 Tax=Peptoniphilus catoniae TaxID=1660341 RepID=UPI0010FD01FD|nr:tRNA threonylcarbamoyladenosine dehydratase [Peptoniphilus catoniae]